MEIIEDLAIVLRSIRYQDRHRIVTALTENHGQLTVMARNSVQSKRFGGTLDVFAASRWTFQTSKTRPHSTLHQLTETSIKQSFEGLRKDFLKVSLASVFTEFLLILAPPHEACSDLFKLHSNALWILEETDFPVWDQSSIALLNIYLIKLLQWSGNQPQLDTCMSCQKSLAEVATPIEQWEASHSRRSAIYAQIETGGWQCAQCSAQGSRAPTPFREGGYPLHPLALQEVKFGLSQTLRQSIATTRAGATEHREIFQFLEAFFIYHIPGFDQQSIKSLRFLGLESSPLLGQAYPLQRSPDSLESATPFSGLPPYAPK